MGWEAGFDWSGLRGDKEGGRRKARERARERRPGFPHMFYYMAVFVYTSAFYINLLCIHDLNHNYTSSTPPPHLQQRQQQQQ